MIEGQIFIFRYNKSIIIFILLTHPNSFSKLGPKLIITFVGYLRQPGGHIEFSARVDVTELAQWP